MNSALPVEQTEKQFLKQNKQKQNSSCVSPTVSSGSVSLGSSGSDSGPAAELVSTAAADEGAVTSCKHTHTHTLKHTLPAFKTVQRPENDQLHYEACRINNITIKKKSWFNVVELSHWEKMVKKCWTCSEKVIFWLFRFWSLCSH